MRNLDAAAAGVCNVGTGRRTSLLELIGLLEELTGRRLPIRRNAARPGDIRHSEASTARLREWLGDQRLAGLRDGLRALLRAEGMLE